jgi:hypothetical protein
MWYNINRKVSKGENMSHIVQCRLCKTRFDANSEPYTLVGKQSYYHKKCYEEWVAGRDSVKTCGDAEFWKESLVDYLYRDVQLAINFVKFKAQWDSFTKPEKKMTPKGIYFAARYYYEVLHGDKTKALGGIGIVQSIYGESAQYWTDLEMRKEGTIQAIIDQIKTRRARPVQTITHNNTSQNKNKSKFSLDQI